MGTAILGIGLPASGKTTYLYGLAVKYGAVYVCPDDIRASLSGDAGNQTVNQNAWEQAYYAIGHGLYNGHDVVVDATNARPEDRQRLIQHCMSHIGTTIIGIWFVTPYDTCMERNISRDRTVPEHAMLRMHKMLCDQPPNKDEGFDILLKHI